MALIILLKPIHYGGIDSQFAYVPSRF